MGLPGGITSRCEAPQIPACAPRSEVGTGISVSNTSAAQRGGVPVSTEAHGWSPEPRSWESANRAVPAQNRSPRQARPSRPEHRCGARTMAPQDHSGVGARSKPPLQTLCAEAQSVPECESSGWLPASPNKCRYAMGPRQWSPGAIRKIRSDENALESSVQVGRPFRFVATLGSDLCSAMRGRWAGA
jgi:hypothetical protein